jgi:dTDP-4-dehydrorhamnose reductase
MRAFPKKRLLITGASGFLGWNICRSASGMYTVIGIGNTHATGLDGVTEVSGDLTDKTVIDRLFAAYKPDAVIHAAAAADPNFCQTFPEKASAINLTATVALARMSNAADIPFLFTSTDLVFDGRQPPYHETDPVCPLNRYGEQKAAAEKEVLSVHPGATVCRMPLMFGDAPAHAKSFIHPMIAALRSGKTLSLFTDEYRTPVSARDAANGLLLLLEKKVRGVVHLGGPEKHSRFDMGCLLAEAMNSNPVITACRQGDIPMSAPRAADVSLVSTRAVDVGFKPHPMRDELMNLTCITQTAG